MTHDYIMMNTFHFLADLYHSVELAVNVLRPEHGKVKLATIDPTNHGYDLNTIYTAIESVNNLIPSFCVSMDFVNVEYVLTIWRK